MHVPLNLQSWFQGWVSPVGRPAWKAAGPELERLRREELRGLDGLRAISLLCGPADYHVPPRVARSTSGLVEHQRWFRKAAGHE
jgi:hypothetical protein